jgi:hypothetical protein
MTFHGEVDGFSVTIRVPIAEIHWRSFGPLSSAIMEICILSNFYRHGFSFVVAATTDSTVSIHNTFGACSATWQTHGGSHEHGHPEN